MNLALSLLLVGVGIVLDIDPADAFLPATHTTSFHCNSHASSASSSSSFSSASSSLLKSSRMGDTETGVTLSEWMTLNPESLVSAPCLIEQTLCQPNDDLPQMAKDFSYAQAVLQAWKNEEGDSEELWDAEWCHCQYQSVEKDDDGDTSTTTALYGHLVRKISDDSSLPPPQQPGVIFFHTGAGPHDLFLLYKAASLVNKGIVVLIADVLSDDTGWAWSSDRTRYNMERNKILNGPDRSILGRRVQAAIATLQSFEFVDSENLAALGWCLGGHAILEVAKLQQHSTIRALATFHGVFDGGTTALTKNEIGETNPSSVKSNAEVLICHGTQDPFVSSESLENALQLLQDLRFRTSLLQLQNAKHGFTNPAQDFNENSAFAYDIEAANKAWRQTLNLLMRAFF